MNCGTTLESAFTVLKTYTAVQPNQMHCNAVGRIDRSTNRDAQRSTLLSFRQHGTKQWLPLSVAQLDFVQDVDADTVFLFLTKHCMRHNIFVCVCTRNLYKKLRTHRTEEQGLTVTSARLLWKWPTEFGTTSGHCHLGLGSLAQATFKSSGMGRNMLVHCRTLLHDGTA